jgi:hypothetical protein
LALAVILILAAACFDAECVAKKLGWHVPAQARAVVRNVVLAAGR